MTSQAPVVHGRGEPRPAFGSVLAAFDHAVTQHAEKTALIHRGRSLDYAAEGRAVAELAGWIEAAGFGGRSVVLLIPNGIEYHIAYFAVLYAGATPVLLNPLYPAPALEPLFADAEPALVLTVPETAEAARALMPRFGHRVLVLGEGDFSPEALAARGPAVWAPRQASPEAPAALMFTGGTTGISKAIIHSHRAMMDAILRIDWGWPTRAQGEVWLPVAPMFHIYGWLFGVGNPVHAAATLVIPDRFQPDHVVDLIARHRVTVFGGGPPAIYQGLMAAQDFETADLSSLAVCGGGGAPFPVEVLKRWKDRTGVDIAEGYGMTEIAPIAVNTDSFGRKAGSVGKPVPDVDIRIADLNDWSRELPTGEAGEVCVRGPHALTGYRNRPDETAATIRDGWVLTGDIGFVDAEGFLTITDRKKDVILVKGFNVFPREVEEVIHQHPDVRGVGVVSLPDARSGERIIAFVVVDPYALTGVAELTAHCKARLVAYKVPAEIRLIEDLPLTPARKLDRIALRRQAAEAAEAAA